MTIAAITAGASILSTVVSAVTVYLTYKSRATILLLEKNTNSMKDALVEITGQKEFERGKLVGAENERSK